jgi:epoxyqueuosine reductase
MGGLQQRLLTELYNNGYKARFVSIERLRNLKEEIGELLDSGVVEKELYEKELKGISYDYTNELPGAKSILVVGMPQPMIKLSLPWGGKTQEVVIPPVYTAETDKQVMRIMETLLNSEDFTFVKAALPLKLLAVKSGLSMYGRNNISYIPELGSFNKLIAFITDMPCIEDSWQDVRTMPACANCNACLKNCPTEAIDPKRFVIHINKCVTYYNEYSGEFPAWLNSNSHNSLVGCMRCQTICPANIGCIKTIEINDAFSEDEISLILNNTEINTLPEKTKNTLEKLNLTDYHKENILSRNLNVLINK